MRSEGSEASHGQSRASALGMRPQRPRLSTQLLHKGIRWAIVGVVVLAVAAVVSGAITRRRIRRVEFWWHRSRDRGAVVFVGDSITEMWSNLAQAFPNWKVANRGINGDHTADILRRLPEDVLPLKPAAVVLLAGSNDLDQGLDAAAVLANLRAIVSALRADSPGLPVAICEIMPRGEPGGSFAGRARDLNARIEAEFGRDPATTVVDTWTPFADSNGAPRADDFPDLIHPGPRGYDKWAAELKPVLTRWAADGTIHAAK